MHVLTFTTLFPNTRQPVLALFVKARMEAFARRHGAEWTVVAPVPWFPRLPFRLPFGADARWREFARVPPVEIQEGRRVYHPRYLVTPKVFMDRYADWMAAGSRALLGRIHRERPIDLIDAHYIYPDGAAAVRLGKELGIPVVLSARGTDLNVFPTLSGIRPRIQSALSGCRALICVSSDLKAKALELGVDPAKTSVIGNGVDLSRFGPGDQRQARALLGLDPDRKVLLSVGNLIEGKGFHILIEALAGLEHKEILLAIAGHGPMLAALRAQAGRLGLGGHVRFLGGVPNAELAPWYRAADVFALATAREGWPNVVSEAQACGTPVVATRVSGIPDIVTSELSGILVRERSVEAFRGALDEAFRRKWDRARIAQAGRSRSWDAVADEVMAVFSAVAGSGR